MMELRTYQTDVIADFEREVAAGRKRILLVAPTGSGKTVIASAVINRAVQQLNYLNALSLTGC
jgi:superfamily II DNA or RNA helicase